MDIAAADAQVGRERDGRTRSHVCETGGALHTQGIEVFFLKDRDSERRRKNHQRLRRNERNKTRVTEKVSHVERNTGAPEAVWLRFGGLEVPRPAERRV